MGGKNSKVVRMSDKNYSHDVIRNVHLEDGIEVFTVEEEKQFRKDNAVSIEKIKMEFQFVFTPERETSRTIFCIDFLISCHYGYKKLAEYLLQNYMWHFYVMYIAFEHCIEYEKTDMCEWLFSFNNINYKQFYYCVEGYGWCKGLTYNDLFKWCCINGKLISAKWMFEHGKIDFKNELMGCFLEKINNNGHKQMLSWLINEVKCTTNERLIEMFGSVE